MGGLCRLCRGLHIMFNLYRLQPALRLVPLNSLCCVFCWLIVKSLPFNIFIPFSTSLLEKDKM
jgi:uncharacterized membrane protein YjgN (DUF898 family)